MARSAIRWCAIFSGRSNSVPQEKKNTREKAAAARATQQAQEKRRERTVRIAGAAGVLTAVALIIGLAVAAPRSDQTAAGAPLPAPNTQAALPAGVLGQDSQTPWAVPYNTQTVDAPLLEIWEDFQCPGCAALEEVNGDGIRQLADSGKVRLVFRPTAFLDANYGTTSSAAAINAWGCAIDQGKTFEYQKVLYANQPTGAGEWTQEDLIGYARGVGISGSALQEFDDCVTSNTYLEWAANSTKAFLDDGVEGTPRGFLNGVVLDGAQLADQGVLVQLVDRAGSGMSGADR